MDVASECDINKEQLGSPTYEPITNVKQTLTDKHMKPDEETEIFATLNGEMENDSAVGKADIKQDEVREHCIKCYEGDIPENQGKISDIDDVGNENDSVGTEDNGDKTEGTKNAAEEIKDDFHHVDGEVLKVNFPDGGEGEGSSKDDGNIENSFSKDKNTNVDHQSDKEVHEHSQSRGELKDVSEDDGIKDNSKMKHQVKEVNDDSLNDLNVLVKLDNNISENDREKKDDVKVKDKSEGDGSIKNKVELNDNSCDDREMNECSQKDIIEVKSKSECDVVSDVEVMDASQADDGVKDAHQGNVNIKEDSLNNGELKENSQQNMAKCNSQEKVNGDTVEESSKVPVKQVGSLLNMLEDIEEGELDYEEEGEIADEEEDLPDLPEYDPSAHKKANGYGSEEGEILSDNEKEATEREEGEILDGDETGQVYICVDPLNDKWKKVTKAPKVPKVQKVPMVPMVLNVLKVSNDGQNKVKELEDGQIDEADEPFIPSPLNTARFIPRTLCKYFNTGLCRWGSTCRFLHPGINDKGIPNNIQPTWNATAGNYVMHRPPGMYPNAYGKAPPPMECINVPVMPSPIVDMSLITPAHTELVVLPVNMIGDVRHEIPVLKESAWEKGLRRAKEIKEAAARRRIEDLDFERKRLSMRIPEHVMDKESDFEPGADPELSAEKALNEWGIRSRDSKSLDYFERRHRGDDRRSERYGSMYADRFSRQQKTSIDRSSGRARLATLPPQHPIRREERQRQRERERRERDEKDKELTITEKDRMEIKNIYKFDRLKSEPEKTAVTDPRLVRPPNDNNTTTVKVPKAVGATEWHDPWMRSQQPPTQIKSESQKQPGVEAISDSDSSSSDSDSDSDSSTSEKSSGSESDGSTSSDGNNKKENTSVVSTSAKSEVPDPRRKDRRDASWPADEKQPIKEKAAKSEPLSYEEWKRLQTIQKAQYHQQMANQYKTALESKETIKKEMSPIRIKDSSRLQKTDRPEDKKTLGVFEKPKDLVPQAKRTTIPVLSSTVNVENTDKNANMRNDDKFDSPKRTSPEKNSDSGSDSDSDSDSDSGSSNSDSDDSESDSESDAEINANVIAAAPKLVKSTAVDTTVRKDIRLNLAEKPKPEIEVPSLAGKRPARKDELLKELKAVEDAIARKRAKID